MPVHCLLKDRLCISITKKRYFINFDDLNKEANEKLYIFTWAPIICLFIALIWLILDTVHCVIP